MVRMGSLTDFERGFLAGLLIGEGHFGVHRGHAHFVLGMHVRHEHLLAAGCRTCCRVRSFTARTTGAAAISTASWCVERALRSLLDIFDSLEFERWCPHVAGRYAAMREVAADDARRQLQGVTRRPVS